MRDERGDVIVVFDDEDAGHSVCCRSLHNCALKRDITEERRLRSQLIHSERLSAVGQLVSGVAYARINALE